MKLHLGIPSLYGSRLGLTTREMCMRFERLKTRIEAKASPVCISMTKGRCGESQEHNVCPGWCDSVD